MHPNHTLGLSTDAYQRQDTMKRSEWRIAKAGLRTFLSTGRPAKRPGRSDRISTEIHQAGHTAPGIRPPEYLPQLAPFLYSARDVLSTASKATRSRRQCGAHRCTTAHRCQRSHNQETNSALEIKDKAGKSKFEPTADAAFNNPLNSSTTARSNRAG